MVAEGASIWGKICLFATPPIAGLQDICPIVSKFWVSIKVRQPSLADASAASIPAWPLPTTITSYSVGSLNTTRSLQNSVSWERQELREIELLHIATERCRENLHIRIKLGVHGAGGFLYFMATAVPTANLEYGAYTRARAF